MRDYAKISPQFWTRGSGKRLRGDADAQVVALYLVTSPAANMIGIYYVPFVAVAHETGLGPERVAGAMKRLETAGFAFYDHDAELAWVPNMASYQLGEAISLKDNRHKGVLAELQRVGQHPFVDRFHEKYAEMYSLPPLPRPFTVPPKPLPSPLEASLVAQGRAGEEQEKEQDPPSVVADATPAPAPKRASRRKPQTSWPKGFSVSPAIEAICRAENLPNPHEVIRQFESKCAAKDYRYADWEAAFRDWMRSPITASHFRPWNETDPPAPPPRPEHGPPRDGTPEELDALLAALAEPPSALDRFGPDPGSDIRLKRGTPLSAELEPRTSGANR